MEGLKAKEVSDPTGGRKEFIKEILQEEPCDLEIAKQVFEEENENG